MAPLFTFVTSRAPGAKHCLFPDDIAKLYSWKHNLGKKTHTKIEKQKNVTSHFLIQSNLDKWNFSVTGKSSTYREIPLIEILDKWNKFHLLNIFDEFTICIYHSPLQYDLFDLFFEHVSDLWLL